MQGYGVDASSVSVASVVIAPPRAETRGDADALSLADFCIVCTPGVLGCSALFPFSSFRLFPRGFRAFPTKKQNYR